MSRLLTIGQVAARLGRSVDFVRQETDEGHLKAEPRGVGEHRYYSEVAVVAYEAREQGHRPRQPTSALPRPRSARPTARRGLSPLIDTGPLQGDELPKHPLMEPMEPYRRTPSSAERSHLETLIMLAGFNAPRDLPAEWRVKLNTDLGEFVTIERFPMADGILNPSTALDRHVAAFLAPYHAATRRDEERQRAQAEATLAARARLGALVAYGREIMENQLRSWAWDDPKSEARRDVELVLQGEVKSDWDESRVRRVVMEVLDQYEEEGEAGGDADAEEEET